MFAPFVSLRVRVPFFASDIVLHPVHLRVWISEGLTQADSSFQGVGILMSVEFYREPPGKFDSRTPTRETLSRWTGRNVI